MLKTLTSWAQRDKTLQETVTFTAKKKENRLKLLRSRRQSPEKLNNPKPLFSRIEELYRQKRSKKMLLHQRVNHADNNNRRKLICVSRHKRQKSHLLSQNVFLQSIIYPSGKKNYWNKQHFSMSKSRVLPTLSSSSRETAVKKISIWVFFCFQ